PRAISTRSLHDALPISAGLMFGGRISENFKLTSGTWVNVGAVRTAFVNALSPLLLDVVIAGENGDDLGVLAFANLPACRAALGRSEEHTSELQSRENLV